MLSSCTSQCNAEEHRRASVKPPFPPSQTPTGRKYSASSGLGMCSECTGDLVKGAIGLDESCEQVPPTGQAVEDSAHHTGRDADGEDGNHLVPGAAQHDLLGFERDGRGQEAGHLQQGSDVPAQLPVQLHCCSPNPQGAVCLHQHRPHGRVWCLCQCGKVDALAAQEECCFPCLCQLSGCTVTCEARLSCICLPMVQQCCVFLEQ